MPRLTREEILNKLEGAIGAGMIRNVDYKDLADDANRAFDADRRVRDDNEPKYDSMDTAERDAFWKLGLPYSVLHVSGFVKRANKKAPNWAWLARRVQTAQQWVPVAEALAAAKPLIVKGRKPSVPNPKLVLRSDALCQCCGRQIEAERGKIAHHGYTRPRLGWQTSSCVGAQFPPYQLSRDRLGWMIETLIKPDLERQSETLAKIDAGQVTMVQGPEVRRDKSDPMYRANDTTTHRHNPMIGRDHPEFERYLKLARASTESMIRLLTSELRDQQKRFDSWVLTKVRKA
jgi:hypothetical protein